MEPHRAERISEALREELTEMIGYELTDPRLETVTVTAANVTPDGKHALVLVSVPGDNAVRQAALQALAGARHYLRRELASRLQVRHVPELRFEPAQGLEGETRVDQLLKRTRKQYRRGQAALEKSPSP